MENNMNAKNEMMDQEKRGKRFKIAMVVGALGAFYFGVSTLDSMSNYFNPFLVLIAAASGFFFMGGIPFGWKAVSKVTNRVECFLFLPIVGWLIYYAFKICAAGCIGGVLFAKECFSGKKNKLQKNNAKEQKREVRIDG